MAYEFMRKIIDTIQRINEDGLHPGSSTKYSIHWEDTATGEEGDDVVPGPMTKESIIHFLLGYAHIEEDERPRIKHQVFYEEDGLLHFTIGLEDETGYFSEDHSMNGYAKPL